jgi:formate hydrogenlyase subunit 3/multisubunit Na+/H+ antiporter MnhD subunit
MTAPAALLLAALALPLAMLVGCLWRPVRERMARWLPLAPAPALAASIWATGTPPLVLPQPFRMVLMLDPAGALLLGTAAFLWIMTGLHAAHLAHLDPRRGRFSVWWLLTLTGNLGVFLVADMVSFYLTYSLVSLAAYGLIAHDDSRPAQRAGVVYVALAVLGEAFLLLGLVFMAAAMPAGGFTIREAAAALPASPWRDAALALIILGFGLKIGLVPGHVWMPLAYPAAPAAAAAAMSGAAVKAGVIGFARFLPLSAAMPVWGEALAAAGIFSAFYGVLVGITQHNPKAVLAYSSVSQMGLLAAVFGMGLAAGDPGAAWSAAFVAAHHVLVKGGLFLAIGAAAMGGTRFWQVLLPGGIIALALAGLPLTGGAFAKLAAKTALGDGLIGVLANVAAAGSALLMLHFLNRLVATMPPRGGAASPALTLPWLMTAIAAMAIPWGFYPSPLDALTPAALWSASWPIAIGAVLFLLLRHWHDRLPRIPAGDIVGAGEAAVIAVARWSVIVERLDTYLRQWSVGVLSLLAVAIVLGLLLAWP